MVQEAEIDRALRDGRIAPDRRIGCRRIVTGPLCHAKPRQDDGIEERRTHLTDATACPRLDLAIDNDRGFEIAIRAGTGACRPIVGKRDSRCDVSPADTVCGDLDISAAIAAGIKGGRVFGKDRIDFLGSFFCHIWLLDVCGRDLHLSAFALFELESGCFFQCRSVNFHRRPAFIEGNRSILPKPGLRIDRRLCILGSQLRDILGEVLLIKGSIDGRTMPGEEDPPAITPALEEPARPSKSHGFLYGFLVIADRKRPEGDLFVRILLGKHQLSLQKLRIFHRKKLLERFLRRTACLCPMDGDAGDDPAITHPKKRCASDADHSQCENQSEYPLPAVSSFTQ